MGHLRYPQAYALDICRRAVRIVPSTQTLEKQMAAFKIGDIVQLKSGGPKMTISEIFDNGTVRTSWFAGSKMEKGVLPVQALSVVSDEPSK
jgi:uncharacterized protein YodC (DUF2158 family)